MKVLLHKAQSRGYANLGWLRAYYTFSFGRYLDQENAGFGMLRVLNEDLIAKEEGFDTHDHQNMEVVTIPLSGFLRHEDSKGNSNVITAGDIQVMSTGTGISHSEYNDSKVDRLFLLQTWVVPKEKDTIPRYEDYDIRSVLKHNEMAFIVAPDGSAPASIHQDAWYSLGTLDKDKEINYKLHNQNNGVYVFVIKGSVLNTEKNLLLDERDGAGFYQTEEVNLKVMSDETQLLMIEVPMYVEK